MNDANRSNVKAPWPRSRWIWLASSVFLLTLIGIASCRFYWHQQFYYHLLGQLSADPAPGQDIWLPDYKVVIDAKPIEGTDNLSGITYDSDKDRLLTVINKGDMAIVALSRSGEVLDRYPLKGFDDVEGLAYMGNGRLALVEESAQQLRFVDLPAAGQEISAQDTPFLALAINLSEHNKGFEGVAYDSAGDRIFVIKERDPRQLYEVYGAAKSLEGRLQLKIHDLTSWIDRSVFGRDISDVYHDPKTGHLLILSDQSKLLIEVDDAGNYVSFRSLLGGITDLKASAPQAEGVTMDHSGNLYVVSEPNLFYAFKKD